MTQGMTTPSKKEEEYFLRLELERKKRREEEQKKHIEASEKKRLKELHHMHCPKCGMQLTEIDYKGIKIDECASCNGIWLDANELQSILEMERPAFKRLFKCFVE